MGPQYIPNGRPEKEDCRQSVSVPWCTRLIRSITYFDSEGSDETPGSQWTLSMELVSLEEDRMECVDEALEAIR